MAHRRARRVRRSRHALTQDTFLSLTLGRPTDDQIKALRPIYLEHKDRFPPGTWAHEWFENGVDLVGPPEPEPVDWDAVPADEIDTVLPGMDAYLRRVVAETPA